MRLPGYFEGMDKFLHLLSGGLFTFASYPFIGCLCLPSCLLVGIGKESVDNIRFTSRLWVTENTLDLCAGFYGSYLALMCFRLLEGF